MPQRKPSEAARIRRPDERFSGFGRYAGPATLILSSLAEGPKHGYALTKDIERFADVRLAPGTLYEALSRLEGQGLIESVESDDRRRPYKLTAVRSRGAADPPGRPATDRRRGAASPRRDVGTGMRRTESVLRNRARRLLRWYPEGVARPLRRRIRGAARRRHRGATPLACTGRSTSRAAASWRVRRGRTGRSAPRPRGPPSDGASSPSAAPCRSSSSSRSPCGPSSRSGGSGRRPNTVSTVLGHVRHVGGDRGVRRCCASPPPLRSSGPSAAGSCRGRGRRSAALPCC